MPFDLRFIIAAVLLASAAIVLDVRRNYEIVPPRLPLESLPHQLGVWRGAYLPIENDVRNVLGRGDFLARRYQRDASDPANVEVFIAYFPSQRNGETIHSPKHCLPGDGWFPLESSQIMVDVTRHAPFPANRYLIARGDDRALVLYWYWAHDRAVANEYLAKYYLLADAIRLNRSDGAMIRISTALHGETVDSAQQRLVAFASELVPIINRYAPP